MSTPDRLFRAFADESRLRILNLLSRRAELCVCDIQAILKAPQPKVSRHLAYLRAAGLVAVRKDGLWKHYALSAPKSGFHKNLLGCLGGCLSEAAVLRRDAAALDRLRTRGGSCLPSK